MSLQISRLINRTLAIQQIPAPTFQEEARAEYLYNEFLAVGADIVEMDAAGNVYARIGSEAGEPIVISAHMDTVFEHDSISPATQHEGRLYGPGVGDNAVALAMLFELLDHYKSGPASQQIWLVANVGEEGLGNLVGMQHVVERFGSKVLAYIVLEGMALGHIYHRGLPVRRFRLHTTTQGGHAWIHAGRPSAIHSLLGLGHDILRMKRPRNRPFSINIGRISGGSSVNSIASEASFEIEIRAKDLSDLNRFTARMIEHIQKAQSNDVAVRLDPIGHRPAGELAADHFLVRSAIKALEEANIAGIRLDTGSTDASLPLSLGMPAICIGITRGGEAHSQKEFIDLEPIPQGFQALIGLVNRLLEIQRHQEDVD